MSDGYLHKLARLYGVQMDYVDAEGRKRKARTATALSVLGALGAPVSRMRDVVGALRLRVREIWQTPVRPVTVVWRGDQVPAAPSIELRIESSKEAGTVRWEVEFEDGGRSESESRLGRLEQIRRRKIDGIEYTCRRLALPADMPEGYHHVTVHVGHVQAGGMLIAAPLQACGRDVIHEPAWGVFLTLHSLWRRASWGAGDMGDLEQLIEWASGRGASVIGMLPMLATQWELGDGPSPYEPTTRLFWNEIYLDVGAVLRQSKSERARAIISQSRFSDELRAMRSSRIVDYTRLWALKRRVLEALADDYFSSGDRSGLESYCRREPLARSLAAFRAAGQRQGRHWEDWPDSMRAGRITRGDYDLRDYHFYLYSQWRMEEQLVSAAGGARSTGAMLYMDLPLGVRGDGFDAWSRRELFVRGMSVGSPPDAFARQGQNWSFPPVHPIRQRQDGYDYFRACLRRHLQYARVLRLDHVMGLHRLYWIPRGNAQADGVYVRYAREELFAVLTLESHRHGAIIVGENLGTVPRIVNDALRRHRIHSMYIVPFEVSSQRRGPRQSDRLNAIKADQLAGMNTHDLPSFKAFWEGLDIDERLRLGMIDASIARRMRAWRRRTCGAIESHLRRLGLLKGTSPSTNQVLLACLAFIGQSDAAVAMMNLEDLWGETSSPNLPNAPADYPNWRRRARVSLEEFSRLPRVIRATQELDDSRRQSRQKVTL